MIQLLLPWRNIHPQPLPATSSKKLNLKEIKKHNTFVPSSSSSSLAPVLLLFTHSFLVQTREREREQLPKMTNEVALRSSYLFPSPHNFISPPYRDDWISYYYYSLFFCLILLFCFWWRRQQVTTLPILRSSSTIKKMGKIGRENVNHFQRMKMICGGHASRRPGVDRLMLYRSVS